MPELTDLIRARVRFGLLPSSSVARQMFGGNGDGLSWACRHGVIDPEQGQYDVRIENGCSEPRVMRLHLRCYLARAAISHAPAVSP